jgi:glycosyltransferase involved in cell wall biosynthesis
MRVLHLLASPVFSGPAENVALLAQAQRALGCEVTIAVDRKRPALQAEEPIVPRLRAMGLLNETAALELSVKSSPIAFVKDLHRLRALDVDLVHAHFTHDHLLARAALWGRPAGRTLLVRSVHAPRSLRWSLPFAHGYTVPSARYLGSLPGRKTAVLRARVDPRFRPSNDRPGLRTKLGFAPAAGPLLGMVSTFQSSRRHLLGLEAFHQLLGVLPSARLVLVGDGQEEGVLRRRVDALGLGAAVQFAGYHSGEAFVRWLQALDCLWLLGLGNDWSGRAAAQARACSVRVIGVDQGALPEWAHAIVPPTPEAISKETLRLLGEPPPAPSPCLPDEALLEFYGALLG